MSAEQYVLTQSHVPDDGTFLYICMNVPKFDVKYTTLYPFY